MILQIAPVMDRTGYYAIDFTTSTHMAVAVRFHKENPWERIRLARAAMPATPLSFLTTGMRFISWERAGDALMALSFRLLIEAGIRRFQVMDPMNDPAAILASARTIRQEGGGEVVAALVYTLSPLHDDAYFARCASVVAGSADVDRVYIKDPGGLLTPERARTLIPAVRSAILGKALELHSHCTIGLAPFSYAVAGELGIDVLHTAAGPLGGGTSQPSTERTIENLRAQGHTTAVDLAALAETSDYFRRLAEAEGLPEGAPSDFDAAYFEHQMPGGMLTTMQRQLAEIGQLDRLAEVLVETARVRAELGFPIMVTPFSQVVGTQAVMNVLAAERYANVPDEVIRYTLGLFGAPPQPVDPDVRDRILARPRAKELAAQPPMAELAEFRRRFGPRMSDEELLLRATMPAGQVDAMLAAGPARRDYDPDNRTVMKLLRELATRPPVAHLTLEKPNFRLELTRRP
jgi:oxaloacetate decarboxylase alpha subunit